MTRQAPPTALDTRFEEIVTAHQKVVRDAIARACPRDLGLQIDDIEQEVRIRLWRALQRETEIRDTASYMYKIALTTTLDAIRRVKARREEQLDLTDAEIAIDRSPRSAADQSPERIVEQRELFTQVATALSRLSDDRRRAAGLYLQGWTQSEIAGLMNWSEARTKNLVYRGLGDLRKLLSEVGIDYGHD